MPHEDRGDGSHLLRPLLSVWPSPSRKTALAGCSTISEFLSLIFPGPWKFERGVCDPKGAERSSFPPALMIRKQTGHQPWLESNESHRRFDIAETQRRKPAHRRPHVRPRRCCFPTRPRLDLRHIRGKSALLGHLCVSDKEVSRRSFQDRLSGIIVTFSSRVLGSSHVEPGPVLWCTRSHLRGDRARSCSESALVRESVALRAFSQDTSEAYFSHILGMGVLVTPRRT